MSEAERIDLVDRAPLTEKQQNVYESIMQYQRVNGYAPTIREICKMVGVASTSSVYAHLKILEEKGYIARKMDASRAIAILDQQSRGMCRHSSELPAKGLQR